MSDVIKCPYCKKELPLGYPAYDLPNEETAEVQCDCGKKFEVNCSRTVDYECVKNCIINNEECEPITNPNTKLTCCVNCGELLSQEKINV